ncbi:MAG: hypothetical protein NVV74_14860 [Magnetospirillum sp.]|nr:hypothetical protein [Magnetospirillum sp.]
MVAIAIAAFLGYVWLGMAGAGLFAALGLWSHWRRWRGLDRRALAAILAAACLLPSVLWVIGYLRPGFAVAAFDAVAPAARRVLSLTAADGKALARLTQQGLAHRFPAVRLGIAAAWLCALPTAAAIVLWWRQVPEEKRWGRDGRYFDPMVLLFLGAAIFALSTVILVSGFGFGASTRNLSDGGGVIYQPIFFAWWLMGVGVLRSWANWWFAPDAPGRQPKP